MALLRDKRGGDLKGYAWEVLYELMVEGGMTRAELHEMVDNAAVEANEARAEEA